MCAETGREAVETEITPEMIEAGMTLLSRYRYDRGNEVETVKAIYRAMLLLAKHPQFP